MKSKFLSIGFRDIIHGFIMAFATAFVTGIIATLESGLLPTIPELQKAGVYGLTVGLIYLSKKLVTNSNDEFLKKETVKNE